MCASTDLLVSCPVRLARFLRARTTSLSIHPLPFEPPHFSVWSVFDSGRHDSELAFLRNEVTQLMRELGNQALEAP